ncbi:MAG: ATP-binding protein, partial [Bacteroidia bacterium]
SDEFTAFHLKFMEKQIKGNDGWQQIISSSAFQAWNGYAYEGVCIKHIHALKRKLGISGVYTEQSSWRLRGSKINNGTQIDLLIDRRDRCINLCEIKFSTDVFEINKSYANVLDLKKRTFKSYTKTNKTVFTTLVTTFGVKPNQYKIQQVDSEVTLDDLFH